MCEMPRKSNDCRTELEPSCREDIVLIFDGGRQDAYLRKSSCGAKSMELPSIVRVGSTHLKQHEKDKRVYVQVPREEIPECAWWDASTRKDDMWKRYKPTDQKAGE
jgi:hypothetical protein